MLFARCARSGGARPVGRTAAHHIRPLDPAGQGGDRGRAGLWPGRTRGLAGHGAHPKLDPDAGQCNAAARDTGPGAMADVPLRRRAPRLAGAARQRARGVLRRCVCFLLPLPLPWLWVLLATN